jgi:2-C-methyl-D-erythritol 4-phosphate cytidylyltransferase
LKRIWGLIPAAGVGARMGLDQPKQYLRLGTRTMLERAAEALLSDTRVHRVLVVTAPHDTRWQPLSFSTACDCVPLGGGTRAQSVWQGLAALRQRGATDADLVLVHDAARPCLSPHDVSQLIDIASTHPDGGVLALPVGDTLKRESTCQPDHIEQTVERAGLWRALTPQCFSLALLQKALDTFANDPAITDEASAIERLGRTPRLVRGLATNLKITTPEDLALAQAILMQQGRW